MNYLFSLNVITTGFVVGKTIVFVIFFGVFLVYFFSKFLFYFGYICYVFLMIFLLHFDIFLMYFQNIIGLLLVCFFVWCLWVFFCDFFRYFRGIFWLLFGTSWFFFVLFGTFWYILIFFGTIQPPKKSLKFQHTL